MKNRLLKVFAVCCSFVSVGALYTDCADGFSTTGSPSVKTVNNSGTSPTAAGTGSTSGTGTSPSPSPAPTSAPAQTQTPTPAPTGNIAATSFSVIGPANGTLVKDTIQVVGIAGSNWVNVAAYEVLNNDPNQLNKVGTDTTPSNGSFTMNLYTASVQNPGSNVHIIVRAFAGSAGTQGSASASVDLYLNITADPAGPQIPSPPPAPTPVPVPVPVPVPLPAPSPGPVPGGSSIPSSSAVPAGATITFNEEFASLNISDNDGDGQVWHTQSVPCCMSDDFNYPSQSNGYPAELGRISAGPGANPFSLASGGGLDIRLQQTNKHWYGGLIASVDSDGKGFSQTYGYFEMRAKIPYAVGTWPAFWMDSVARITTNKVGYYNSQAEIDIFEEYGTGNPAQPNALITLHDWAGGTTPYGSAFIGNVPNFADGNFHSYGFLWTSTTMTFYFDGVAFQTTSTPAIMRQPHFLIANLGLGGAWPTKNTPLVNDMIITYIRAYKLP